MKHIFFFLFTLTVSSAYNSQAQDTVLVKGYYIIRYNKSEIESKEKNLILKKEGRKYFEPIDYERAYYFIPNNDSLTSIEESVSSYICDYKATNYYLPQDGYKRKFIFTTLGKSIIEKESSYFNNPVYYASDNKKFLYCIYRIEAKAIKYQLQNTKEIRYKFNLRVDEVSKGNTFDVVLLYHYTFVANDFIHLDGFEKWTY